MKITFILPCVGKKAQGTYPRSWVMEPLGIAVLAGLTPPAIDKVFYDDRIEPIPYDDPTDLVALSVETYTARRAYQIAAEYRRRGVPVVMGGFHATLVPDEAERYADAVVVGEAENIWAQLLADAAAGKLQKRYAAAARTDLRGIFPDRSIFKGKPYSLIGLVESARGCIFHCDFCSVASFYQSSYRARPIADVVEEIRSMRQRNIFFVDDNYCADLQRARELSEALIPLKVRWITQASINVAHDPELLRLMKRSGCMGLLIGFESLNPDTLSSMGKRVNDAWRYRDEALDTLQRHGMGIYATFVFGYDNDTEESFNQTFQFAYERRFFFTAFNHLVPFPGTPLYQRLQAEKRLLHDPWWLNPQGTFGDVVFRPAHFTPQSLAETCQQYRERFYGLRSVLHRATNLRSNSSGLFMSGVYWIQNLGQRREIARRWALPFGMSQEPSPEIIKAVQS
jgi:radical SAM superfamily enzyme YgiQ (UPF0313 family)